MDEISAPQAIPKTASAWADATRRRRLAPALYVLAGALLIWCAHSRSFIGEDAVKIPVYCGWFQSASYDKLLLSRETGEDGSYYRAAENIVLGTASKIFGCQSDAPFRLAAGIIWLLCAASIVPPLRRAGASPYAAWTTAALLMAHPYNSFCFLSPAAACNMLIIPAAAGAWLDRAKSADWRGPAVGGGACLHRQPSARVVRRERGQRIYVI